MHPPHHRLKHDLVGCTASTATKIDDKHSLDVQDLGPGDDVDSLLGRDGVSDLTGELASVHHEEVDLSGVVDEHDLVAGGDHVSGEMVGSVTEECEEEY